MTIPADLKYTAEHEWLRIDNVVATVGITEFAAQSLGDVVFVQVPSIGETVTVGKACGEIESTKSVSDIFAPADGRVTEVNDAVIDEPGLVNTDPYGQGWLFKLQVAELPELLDAARYSALTNARGK